MDGVTEAVIDVTESVNSVTPSIDDLRKFYNQECRWEGEIRGDSWEQQREVEQNLFLLRQSLMQRNLESSLTLFRDRHIAYLLRSLDYLPRGYESLSAARPWIMFWIVHSLDLLGANITGEVATRVVKHIQQFWDPERGAFGGGRGQTAHVVSTYAAVAALCTIGTNEAYSAINVTALHAFLREMKLENGCFRVEKSGESDVRAIYSALAVASITGILSRDPTLGERCAEHLITLQAFDGGFGGEPGNEAHGGNTYCGTAALVALGKLSAVNTEALLDWSVMRQMSYEGGFQGRTNKLVDSCYSFWVGALFPLLRFTRVTDFYHPVSSNMEAHNTKKYCNLIPLFDGTSLQRYVLQCSQNTRGGFCDKPSVPVDLLHTCYALSGLSIAQEYGGVQAYESCELRSTDPVYNVSVAKAVEARLFFDQLV